MEVLELGWSKKVNIKRILISIQQIFGVLKQISNTRI